MLPDQRPKRSNFVFLLAYTDIRIPVWVFLGILAPLVLLITFFVLVLFEQINVWGSTGQDFSLCLLGCRYEHH